MTDYLTKLPTELFLDICQRVQDAKQGPYLGAVSKAFLRLAREATFGDTTVRTYDRLQKLCDMAKCASDVVLSIRTLRLELEDAKDLDLPKSKELTALFQSLVNTTALDVRGSSRIAKMVLAPRKGRRSSPSLPCLQALSIDGRFAFERSLRSELAHCFERERRLPPSPHSLCWRWAGDEQWRLGGWDAGQPVSSIVCSYPLSERRGGGGRSVLRSHPLASSRLPTRRTVQLQPLVARSHAHILLVASLGSLDSSRSAPRSSSAS
ncbi:hypothetical protein BJY59DRAFT_450552 [Rhodotorula toruloides]